MHVRIPVVVSGFLCNQPLTIISGGRLDVVVKTMENSKIAILECCRDRLREVVVYGKFQLLGLDWENFSVLDKWSLIGGSRLREVMAHGGLIV